MSSPWSCFSTLYRWYSPIFCVGLCSTGDRSRSLAFQWLRSGKAVAGATGASYALTAADIGKVLKVKVTGSKQGYKTVAKTSKSTKKVK